MPDSMSLVGDIGGTNARFALVKNGETRLHNIEVLTGEEYPELEGAVSAYLDKYDVTSPDSACLAVAGPIINSQVRFTNSPWTIAKDHFQHRFKLSVFELVNDFAAQAMAVPHLDVDNPRELRRIGPVVEGDSHAPRLVIGPGTGLGVCSLVETDGGWRA
ncbi:glucokinase, partial [Sansalvadorimonas verongulae]|uniref:glucokinase n=1 Tax=Sansalvadorimonas verongulae TaxID=2172824 RepID=UPI0018AD1927